MPRRSGRNRAPRATARCDRRRASTVVRAWRAQRHRPPRPSADRLTRRVRRDCSPDRGNGGEINAPISACRIGLLALEALDRLLGGGVAAGRLSTATNSASAPVAEVPVKLPRVRTSASRGWLTIDAQLPVVTAVDQRTIGGRRRSSSGSACCARRLLCGDDVLRCCIDCLQWAFPMSGIDTNCLTSIHTECMETGAGRPSTIRRRPPRAEPAGDDGAYVLRSPEPLKPCALHRQWLEQWARRRRMRSFSPGVMGLGQWRKLSYARCAGPPSRRACSATCRRGSRWWCCRTTASTTPLLMLAAMRGPAGVHGVERLLPAHQRTTPRSRASSTRCGPALVYASDAERLRRGHRQRGAGRGHRLQPRRRQPPQRAQQRASRTAETRQ